MTTEKPMRGVLAMRKKTGLFIGVSQHGSDTEIEKIDLGLIRSNRDDISLEVEKHLGINHPFVERAEFGLYFGTTFT